MAEDQILGAGDNMGADCHVSPHSWSDFFVQVALRDTWMGKRKEKKEERKTEDGPQCQKGQRNKDERSHSIWLLGCLGLLNSKATLLGERQLFKMQLKVKNIFYFTAY